MTVIGRRAMCTGVLLVALFIPVAAPGNEADDLKAAAERLWAALNTSDLDTWSTLVHDQAVGFNLISPFPVEGKAAMRQTLQSLFNTMERFTITPLNFQYRSIGDMGIAWGHVVVAFKPKDGPIRTMWGREILTYTKVEGKWRMVTVHASSIPTGGL
jgi:ketosteroid isomerase-like protein